MMITFNSYGKIFILISLNNHNKIRLNTEVRVEVTNEMSLYL